MLCTTAPLTVSAATAEIPFSVAEMLALPMPTPVASPCVLPALETVATEVALDDQPTVPLMSCDVPSEKEPVAVNCCVRPLGTLAVAGVRVMAVRTAGRTVKVWASLIPENVAGMVAVPCATPVASPGTTPALEPVAPGGAAEGAAASPVP